MGTRRTPRLSVSGAIGEPPRRLRSPDDLCQVRAARWLWPARAEPSGAHRGSRLPVSCQERPSPSGQWTVTILQGDYPWAELYGISYFVCANQRSLSQFILTRLAANPFCCCCLFSF